MPHLGESFVLKRRKSPNIPTLAFVNESVGKEISNSGWKFWSIHKSESESVKKEILKSDREKLHNSQNWKWKCVEGSFELWWGGLLVLYSCCTIPKKYMHELRLTWNLDMKRLTYFQCIPSYSWQIWKRSNAMTSNNRPGSLQAAEVDWAQAWWSKLIS